MIFATARLTARRFEPRDLLAFVTLRNDAEVARFQSWDGCSEQQGRDFLAEMAAKQLGEPGWLQIALEETATGRLVGDCAIDIDAADSRLARIGYTIARPCWNHGFATEAVTALAAFAFDRFTLHRITASVDPRNAASCRVLEKAGFVREALFRQSEWFKGEWTDDAVYARLRTGHDL